MSAIAVDATFPGRIVDRAVRHGIGNTVQDFGAIELTLFR
jgi:hypothetical protein